MTSECDLVTNRVLICLQLTAEEFIFCKPPKKVFSFEEAIESFNPQIEIELVDEGKHEMEVLEIKDYQDLSFSFLLSKSTIIKKVMKYLECSFLDLYESLISEHIVTNEMKPFLIESNTKSNKKEILTNLQFVFYATRMLQANYSKLAQFFYSIPQHHYACRATPVSLFNASIEQLTDLDYNPFIQCIEDELASAFDSFDNSEAYSLLLLPDKFIYNDYIKDHEKIYTKYLSICKKYNVLFISEFRNEYDFNEKLYQSNKYNSSWYFMSTDLVGIDIHSPDFKINLGLSHLLCAYILANNWFYFNNLDCDTALPHRFAEPNFSLTKKDSHFFYYNNWYVEKEHSNRGNDIDTGFLSRLFKKRKESSEMSFVLSRESSGGGELIFQGIGTNIIKVFANKLLFVLNKNQFNINLLNHDRRDLKDLIKAEIEAEIGSFNGLISQIKMNRKYEWGDLTIHSINYLVTSPITMDIFCLEPIDIKAQLSFVEYSYNYSDLGILKEKSLFESAKKFTIHVSNYKRICDKIEFCNIIDVNYGYFSYW